MGGRRDLKSVPYHLKETDPDLYNFLLDLINSEADGVPGGAGSTGVTTVGASGTSDPGTEGQGWAPINHTHPVHTASAVGLADANSEGGGDALARAVHTHKRDVKVALAGSVVGTRNRLNFVDSSQIDFQVTDDAGNDEVDITAALVPASYDHDIAWLRPTTVNANDDEFRDASIAGAWTQTDPVAPVTWTELGDSISVVTTNNAIAELHALTKPITSIAAGTYIECAFRILHQNQNYPMAGLIFSDGSTAGAGVQVAALAYWDITAPGDFMGFQLHRSTGFDTFVSNALGNIVRVSGRYTHMRLVWVAANSFRLDLSPDGASWVTIVGPSALTLTPTRGGLVASTYGASQSMVASFDYFRVQL